MWLHCLLCLNSKLYQIYPIPAERNVATSFTSKNWPFLRDSKYINDERVEVKVFPYTTSKFPATRRLKHFAPQILTKQQIANNQAKQRKTVYTMSSDSNEIELESTSEQKFGVWIDDKLN